MRKIGFAVLAIAGLALTGCGGAAQVEVDPALCLDVPAGLQSDITDASAETQIEAVKASAFKSPDYPSAYLIAMEFSAPGGDNEVGVWSTSELSGGAPMFAVDGMAKTFTTLKHSVDSVVPLDSTSTGVDEAKSCVANS